MKYQVVCVKLTRLTIDIMVLPVLLNAQPCTLHNGCMVAPRGVGQEAALVARKELLDEFGSQANGASARNTLETSKSCGADILWSKNRVYLSNCNSFVFDCRRVLSVDQFCGEFAEERRAWAVISLA